MSETLPQGTGVFSRNIRDLNTRVRRLEPRIVSNGESLTVLPRGVTRRTRSVAPVAPTASDTTARWA